MIVSRTTFVLLLSATLAGPLAAQESGSFVTLLGQDTLGVERYTRRGTRLEIEQVGRSPRVLRRHVTLDFGSGASRQASVRVTVPSAAPNATPFQTTLVTFDTDSTRVETRRDTSITRTSVFVPKGALLASSSAPWSVYEHQTMRLTAGRADSLRSDLWFVGNPSVSWVTVRKLGADSAVVLTENGRWHAKIDRRGRVLGARPISGTQKIGVVRVPALDLDAMTASFAAREQQVGPMGALSTRDTVRVTAAGANLWIDYGRPAKRGRVIFGNVVPFGELWRTGANAATQLRTDKALDFGGVTVPAGTYSLFTVPGPDRWKLIVNAESGQPGTAHDPAKDLVTIELAVSALPAPVERFTIGVLPAENGGTLTLEWDTTRAAAPFTVKP